MPDNFPVKQETVASLLTSGPDLASLRDAGRLYLLDLVDPRRVPVVPGRFLCAPMCLFYVDERSRLMPLAIQLGQSPDAGPIFTPHDDPWLWRTVKTHVQCADAQVQECASHLLRTHLVMETVAVAMHRQLSVAHPLHQLLVPHCRFTMAINHSARTKMLAPGGPIAETMSVGREGALELCAKAWKNWSFDAIRPAQRPQEPAASTIRTAARLSLSRRCAEALGRDRRVRRRRASAILSQRRRCRRRLRTAGVGARTRRPGDRQFQGVRGRAAGSDGRTGSSISRRRSSSSPPRSIRAPTTASTTCTPSYPTFPGAIFAAPPTTKAPLTEQSLFDSLPRPRTAAKQIGMVHLLSEPTETPMGRYTPEVLRRKSGDRADRQAL